MFYLNIVIIYYILLNIAVTISNVGDSRCIMLSNPVQRLSVDHKPTNPNEATRLSNNGFVVFNERLNGTLAVSRAFGDWNLKNKGLTRYNHLYFKVMVYSF